MIDTDEVNLVIPQSGGNYELDIEDNTTFSIKLKGNITTGFSWFLNNADELKSSNIIEPLNIDEHNGSKEYITEERGKVVCGAGGYSLFKFKVNNASGKVLPKINLVYKRPWEPDGLQDIADIMLKLKNVIDKEITLPQNATQGEIEIKEGDIFSIKIKGNPTTGYSWFLINDEEAINLGITPLNLNEHKSGSYISHNPKGMVGGGGIFDFQFKVNKFSHETPILKFTYRRPWIPASDDDRKLEINLVKAA